LLNKFSKYHTNLASYWCCYMYVLSNFICTCMSKPRLLYMQFLKFDCYNLIDSSAGLINLFALFTKSSVVCTMQIAPKLFHLLLRLHTVDVMEAVHLILLQWVHQQFSLAYPSDANPCSLTLPLMQNLYLSVANVGTKYQSCFGSSSIRWKTNQVSRIR
jgi:hypothetical protein